MRHLPRCPVTGIRTTAENTKSSGSVKRVSMARDGARRTPTERAVDFGNVGSKKRTSKKEWSVAENNCAKPNPPTQARA